MQLVRYLYNNRSLRYYIGYPDTGMRSYVQTNLTYLLDHIEAKLPITEREKGTVLLDNIQHIDKLQETHPELFI